VSRTESSRSSVLPGPTSTCPAVPAPRASRSRSPEVPQATSPVPEPQPSMVHPLRSASRRPPKRLYYLSARETTFPHAPTTSCLDAHHALLPTSTEEPMIAGPAATPLSVLQRRLGQPTRVQPGRSRTPVMTP